ncbi:MAG: ABC transporter permease [Clostridiales bacterium]|jgi:NitT/TauT family transport system permease protein|nr:ABC transporter permease [Clostridiales bacterium]
MKTRTILKCARQIGFRFSSVLIFLLLWEMCARLGLLVNPLFLPPFSKVMAALIAMARSGVLWKHAAISLQRSLLGFALGMLFSVPFGLCIGWFKRFGGFLNPLLQTFRNMPTLALLPVFVMFFGIGEFSKVMVIFWGVLWSVLLNTIAGVHSVDPQMIKASRVMGTGSVRLFASVILPASLPFIFTGMRISATTSILILIAAEMIGASKGLGYALFFYQSNMKIPEMFAYIIVMAVIGVALNFALEVMERHSFRWRESAKAE